MTVRNIAVSFTPEWQTTGQWYAVLSIVMKNNSGKTLENPEIKIELGQQATATQNSGYSFTQSGKVLTGHLQPTLRPVQNGASVTFTIGLNYSGDFNGDFPVAYWVDGQLAEGGGGGGELDDEPPTQPTGLKETGVTDTTIALSWNASTDNVGVSHYIIYTSSAEGNKTEIVSNTSAVLSGLKPKTRYDISVSAVDLAGNESKKSSVLSVTTKEQIVDKEPPTVPTNVHAENISSTSATIKWTPSTDNVAVAGYQIVYADASGAEKTVESTGASVTLSGLKPDTAYTVKVLAVDTSGNKSAYSKPLSITTSSAGSATVDYAPYVDVTMFANWSTTPPAMNTLFVKDALELGAKKFHLAFVAYDRASKSVVWGNRYFPLASVKTLVDLINSKGGEAIFAFGGFSGLDPSVDMSVAELTKLYVDISKEYKVRHIDFDFETIGLYNYSKAFEAAIAAKKQKPDLHFSLTLPVLPTGLVAEGLTMIGAAKNAGLDVSVQIMAMDYGQGTADMGNAAVQAAISTKTQLAKIYPEKSEAELFALIGVTPMIGVNDTAPETFYLKNIPTLTDFAKQKGIALIGSWDLNRDFPKGRDHHGFDHYDLATSALEPNQTKAYEFLINFLKGLSS